MRLPAVQAGITTILNSRTSVLAAANPVFGSYSDSHAEFEVMMRASGEKLMDNKDLHPLVFRNQNIEFQSTILSRFDMIFLVRDARNEDTDRVRVATNAARAVSAWLLPLAAYRQPCYWGSHECSERARYGENRHL